MEENQRKKKIIQNKFESEGVDIEQWLIWGCRERGQGPEPKQKVKVIKLK